MSLGLPHLHSLLSISEPTDYMNCLVLHAAYIYKHFQKSLQRELEDDLIIYLREDNSRIYTEVTAV